MEEDAKGDIVKRGDSIPVERSRTEQVGAFLKAVVEEMKLNVGPQTLKLYTKMPSKDESKAALGSKQKLPDEAEFYVKVPMSAGKRRQRFL